ncbi:MAG: TIGR01777 family oxidoreductase [Opitutaceae bacterium]|nr:TIGR01777 family oxidoreductase [Opitutaceae bacterium]
MKTLIAGASGLVGSALVAALRGSGHEVHRLVRRAAAAPDEIPWHPERRELEPPHIHGMDAVINLSGENVGAGRWTAARRERILRSRIDATATLVKAMAAAARKPSVFLSASAVGFYGDRGDEVLTEAAGVGQGFLPEVCLAWETHAEGASRSGVRTVLTRFGVVLAPNGGALAKMLPLFRAGFGGRLGHGRQWMSWIAIEDVVGALMHCLTNPVCRGPINVVAPDPVTNADFTAALARVLQRPAVLPAPAWALRAVLGRMADEALLASTRPVPEKLLKSGYLFRQPDLDEALGSVLRLAAVIG